MIKIGLLFAVIIFFTGCGKKDHVEFVYCNPYTQVQMRDTHVIPNPDDGKFYTVGTLFWGGKDKDGNAGFRLYESENMKDWHAGPWIMKQSELPEDAWYQTRFWAPEIHKINGKWYFTFNCGGPVSVNRDLYVDFHGSGIWVADRITGPYKDLTAQPLAPWPSNDLTLFQDDNDKVYAFFNDGFFDMKKNPDAKHSIYVAEVDLEKGELKEDPHKLLTQQDGFESMGIEGAHVVKVEGVYYLFYSGWKGGYAVGYATASNIYGPYTRAKENPLFGAQHAGGLVVNGVVDNKIDHPYREIGHNQIFKGPDGRFWTSCHAYLKGGDNQFGAVLIYDPLEFKNGKVITSAPTWTEQTIVVDPEMAALFPGLRKMH